MKAVILVGGEGTRLRPLTIHRPKPMQPVANRPFIEHVFRHLKAHGITDIILSICYLPDVIQDYFGDGSDLGIHLTYVMEEVALGTAGAVKNVELQGYLDSTEPFFVLNGDILTDLDLSAMLAFHRGQGAQGTIALTPVEDVRAYGLVDCDEAGRVRRFIEKPKSLEGITTNLINAGTYILNPSVLRFVPPNQFYQFEQGLFPTLLREGNPLFGYPSETYWLDIGTPEKYKTANFDMLLGLVSGEMPGEQRAERVRVGKGCQIAPTAEIVGPVVMGNHCVIGTGARLVGPLALGDGCEIGPGVQIERAVLWEQVTVGVPPDSEWLEADAPHHSGSGNGRSERAAGTMLTKEPVKIDPTIKTDMTIVRDCVIGYRCTLEPGCQVNGAIIADHCSIERGNQLAGGIKLWPYRTLTAQTITF
ncbi:MAG TPA: NDP-sugar synthase [Ktedonobacterales bacterium]